MSICFYPRNKEFTLRDPTAFRFVNEIILNYSLSKTILDRIIKKILIEFCDTPFIGYDNCQDKFWCKRYSNTICSLHIDISIVFKSSHCSEIKIQPLIGTNQDINIFVYELNDTIKMYKTSNFIKSILEDQ